MTLVVRLGHVKGDRDPCVATVTPVDVPSGVVEISEPAVLLTDPTSLVATT